MFGYDADEFIKMGIPNPDDIDEKPPAAKIFGKKEDLAKEGDTQEEKKVDNIESEVELGTTKAKTSVMKPLSEENAELKQESTPK